MTQVIEYTQPGRPALNRKIGHPGNKRVMAAPEGPWTEEPDKIQWVDEETDLDCLMVRNPMGAWCGYVGVVEGHPFFGLGYGDCMVDGCSESWCDHTPESRVSVHGGLTFADFCHESEQGPEFGICHVPFPGRTDRVWWLGFDTAHAGDLTPSDAAYAMEDSELGRLYRAHGGDVYRDRAYVEAQCTALAKQLAEVNQ